MKFKKSIGLFLAMLLLVCNTGFALTVHFCEGKISSISSDFQTEETCADETEESSCCGSKVENSHEQCCSDKVIDLQDNTDDVVVKAFSIQFESPFIIQQWQPFICGYDAVTLISSSADYYCETHAPPLFKLYKQYIFYA